MPVEVEPLTRTLAHVLRHEPWRHGVDVDAAGWADVGHLVQRLRARRYPELTRADVERAVAHDPHRFELQRGRIRARYGHSLPVEVGVVQEPPPTLYAAVPRAAFRDVAVQGLRPPKGRVAVHLAEAADAAREVAQRKDKDPVLLEVRAGEARRDGIVFRRSGDVWLTSDVPARFLHARG